MNDLLTVAPLLALPPGAVLLAPIIQNPGLVGDLLGPASTSVGDFLKSAREFVNLGNP